MGVWEVPGVEEGPEARVDLGRTPRARAREMEAMEAEEVEEVPGAVEVEREEALRW